MQRLSQDFTADDHMVITGGTNAINKLLVQHPIVGEKIGVVNHVGVLFTNILHWFETSEFEAAQKGVNDHMRKV